MVVAQVSSITFLTVGFLFVTTNVAFGFIPIISMSKRRQSFDTITFSISLSNEDSDKTSLSLWSHDSDVDVQVYDNTFSPLACKVIHALAVENSFRVNSETSFFLRPPWNERPLTPLEHAMDSALTALNDQSKLVEYWSREEYMNIDAHVDIDERRLEDEGHLAVPSYSHVLYLEVNVRGPTCIFPSKLVGWGLENEKLSSTVDLVIVPAVQGRILRFPGSAMHAVPCPVDRWLRSEEEETKLREEEQGGGDDDDDDDELFDDFDEEEDEEGDGEEDEIERSVLLFNTWSDDGPPPLGAMERTYYDTIGGTRDAEQLAGEWEEDYGVNAQLIHCIPRSEWREKFLTKGATLNEEESKHKQIRVSLMGDQNRRVYPDKTARLIGPFQELQDALQQENEMTWFRLANGSPAF